jgi:hypothetical protein
LIGAQAEHRSIRLGVSSTLNLDLSLGLPMGHAQSGVHQLSPLGPSRSSRMSRTFRVKETMRAVKGSLGHSFKEMGRELEESRSTDALHNVQPGVLEY